MALFSNVFVARPLFWVFFFLAGLGITTSWHQGAKGDVFAGTGGCSVETMPPQRKHRFQRIPQ